ncbi:DUF3325 domain-containing protein [Azospirillum doebereinerae]|uniref:DUF3325 domain-containing protein n=1 Tax=Azospirillum doebereinerae TaxID=92933 RepID=A0A3S0WVN3_9PROT|nr:DUF3325 domain-containing protein [Azospirillum doebereinerae]MCG5241627.1 DUF3325 domain-containing protein [Azospirillum doebereinerae]RUQ64060.1 DUF3325 domain-containing protein [Azospirillum doebereinerae]
MSHPLSFMLCLAGFTALAFAMDRQQHDLIGRSLPASVTRALRIAGACALLLALGVLVAWQGWGLGLVMFSGHTSLTAGIVHVTLIGSARVYARASKH